MIECQEIKTCSICLEEIIKNDTCNKIVTNECCGGQFHEKCLKKWTKNCPLCRYNHENFQEISIENSNTDESLSNNSRTEENYCFNKFIWFCYIAYIALFMFILIFICLPKGTTLH